MKKVLGLECFGCAGQFGLSKAKYACPACGGNLQVVYDFKEVRKTFSRKTLEADRDLSVWRYLPVLPMAGGRSQAPIQIGWTPLYKVDRLAREFGAGAVYVKDDGRNPSASFKDRAGAVAAGRAIEIGEKAIAAASTGNAASSLACVAGSLGLKTILFVPETAPAAKIAQLLVFGATVIAVKGTYDDAFDLCLKACGEYGWYNRSTGVNPFTREGKKTAAFELCEQLGWKVPDKVFVPVGDGNIISGVWKGFLDAFKCGLIDRLPALIAVQGGASDSVKRALETDGLVRPVSGATVADSISVSLPRDGAAAVRAVTESQGRAVAVSDAEILAAIPALARSANVFAEPAGAAAYAGFVKAAREGLVRKGDTVVLLATGNGLKDVASAMKSVGRPLGVRPDLKELKALVRKERL